MKVVISQSMLFPWVGMLEQISLADVFVHYDDVQFSKGSFSNRVQIKTENGSRWMTIPLDSYRFGQKINEISIKPKSIWVDKHLAFLKQSFKGAPYVEDVLGIVDSVYSQDYANLAMLVRASTLAVANYYSCLSNTRIVDVFDLNVPGAGSERVVDVVKLVQGSHYITGHGAKNYINHQLFENSKIDVSYMDYKKTQYAQLHGDFTPYVSSLDLIANCGPDGIKKINSDAIYWKTFLRDST